LECQPDRFLTQNTNNNMKPAMRLIILVLFLTTGCGAIKAQRQPEYILVELFSDEDLTQRDSLSRINMYSSNSNQKDSLERRGRNVFLFPEKGIEKLIIEAGGVATQFEVPTRVRGKRFLVINANLNRLAAPGNVSLNVRKGDVIYVIKKCDNDCHTIWLRNPSLLHLQDNTITTGFPQLDQVIFDEKK
jgi:hypothetical protein